jgi:hypothetical protein
MSAKELITMGRERLASPLTWHLAGFVALLALSITLVTRLAMDWSAVRASSSDALAGKQLQMRSLDHETEPLRGLDQRVALARTQVGEFYAKRIPHNYSSISNRIGELQVASGVRLTRVQYTQADPETGLSEITLDAGISGEYPAIMRFINSVERDQTFFIIRAMTLTSQQGGAVNLRLRLSTWMRAEDAAASGLPPTPPPARNPAEKEGE